jgi:hypothetical protein
MGEKDKHKVRLCKLKKDGKLDEVGRHGLNTIVYCDKCKAKADDPSCICNPRALKPSKAKPSHTE